MRERSSWILSLLTAYIEICCCLLLNVCIEICGTVGSERERGR